MILSSYIKKAISEAKLFDNEFKLVSTDRVVEEFDSIKNYLLNHFKKGDRVGLNLTKDYRYLLTMLGCMQIGLTYIPIRKDWPDERKQQIQELSNCVMVDDSILQSMINVKEKSTKESFDIKKDDTLYIIYPQAQQGFQKVWLLKERLMKTMFCGLMSILT